MALWHWACALRVVQRAREPAYLAMRLPPTPTTIPLATSESILAIVIPSFVIYIVRQSIKAYPQGWPLTTASTTLASRGDKMTSQQTSASVNASQWRSLCPNNFCDLLTLLNCFSLVLHPGLPPYPPPFFHPDDFSPPPHLIPFLSSRNEWFNGCDGPSLTLHLCRFQSYQFCKTGMSLWMKVFLFPVFLLIMPWIA